MSAEYMSDDIKTGLFKQVNCQNIQNLQECGSYLNTFDQVKLWSASLSFNIPI